MRERRGDGADRVDSSDAANERTGEFNGQRVQHDPNAGHLHARERRHRRGTQLRNELHHREHRQRRLRLCQPHSERFHLFVSPSLSNVTVQNCTTLGIGLGADSNITIARSTMSNPLVIQGGANIVVDHNTISTTAPRSAAAIYLTAVSNSQITNNTLDGGYHGNDLAGQGSDGPGADDGIVLGDVSSSTISGNVISNVFDAGIEGVDSVSNSTIANNTITRAVFAGLGAYHCTSWQGNTISGNVISQSVAAMDEFVQIDQLCNLGGANPPGAFNGNTIVNNTFRNPLGGALFGMSFVFNLPLTVAGGNVIRGNDMGRAGISALPPGRVRGRRRQLRCGPSGTFSC